MNDQDYAIEVFFPKTSPFEPNGFITRRIKAWGVKRKMRLIRIQGFTYPKARFQIDYYA